MTTASLRPGEIYWADDVVNDKRHLVIIVSREEHNRGSYVVVVPTTSQGFSRRQHLRNCVAFGAGDFCFSVPTVAQAENISLIEKSELDLWTGPVDMLDPEVMRNVIRAVGYVIEADCEPS